MVHVMLILTTHNTQADIPAAVAVARERKLI